MIVLGLHPKCRNETTRMCDDTYRLGRRIRQANAVQIRPSWILLRLQSNQRRSEADGGKYLLREKNEEKEEHHMEPRPHD